MNVVAQNSQGKTVKGLTRRDFSILDNGKPQQISVFSIESSQSSQKPIEPLPPNTFSNRVARNGNGPVNVAVILLDGKDTGFADSVFARDELIKIIRQVPSDNRIAVYVLGRWGLSVIQDFTSDPSSLLEAIRGYHGYADEESAVPRAVGDVGTPPLSTKNAADRIRADVIEHTPPDLAGYRTTDTCKLIEAIAGHLSGMPGRKSLIWVTDHIPFPEPGQAYGLSYGDNLADLQRRMREAVEALNQADVAVYPVDAHGLVVGPSNIGLYRAGLPPPLWPGEVWTTEMDIWARQTGGRAYYYTNGLGQAALKALEDSEATYTLGYYPSDIAWNGQYHHIKVLVGRKDAELRYRRGYYATSTKVNANADPVGLLAAEAGSPLDSTAIGVTVRLTPEGDPPSRQLKAAVYVDASGLTFEPENGHYDASFMVWAGEYSPKGALLKVKTKKLSFKLSEADYGKVLGGGLGVNIQEAADPKASELRVAVLDLTSLATGSVRVALHQ